MPGLNATLGGSGWTVPPISPARGQLGQVSADVTAGRDFAAADFMSSGNGEMFVNSGSAQAFLLPTVAAMGLSGAGNMLVLTISGAGIPTFAGKTSSTTINGVAGTTTVLPARGAPVRYSTVFLKQRGSSDVWDLS